MDAIIAAISAVAVAVLTATKTVFDATPKAVVDAAVAELAAAVTAAEPVFAPEAISSDDFEATRGRRAQGEMIALGNNATYLRLVHTPAGPMHVFRASRHSAEGAAIHTGLKVYLVDADLDTPIQNRAPVWAAPTSRIGLKIVDAAAAPARSSKPAGEITEIAFRYWGNRVRVTRETEKALRFTVEKSFEGGVNNGATAWFPKSALELEDDGTGLVFVKEWFVRKGLSKAQARVLGQCD